MVSLFVKSWSSYGVWEVFHFVWAFQQIMKEKKTKRKETKGRHYGNRLKQTEEKKIPLDFHIQMFSFTAENMKKVVFAGFGIYFPCLCHMHKGEL